MALNIALYANLGRTLTPCSGVGRHCNEVGLVLAKREGVEVEFLTSHKNINSRGQLPSNAPLGSLPLKPHKMSTSGSEKYRKLFGRPQFDSIIAPKTNWLYSPHDTRLISHRVPTAITIHDARIFEPHLAPKSPKQVMENSIMKYWTQKACEEAKLVFTVSDYSRKRLAKLLNLPLDKFISIGNGYNSFSGMSLAQNSPNNSDLFSPPPRIVYTGGIRYLKGGDTLISFAKALLAEQPEFIIDCIGGPDDPTLRKAAEALPNIQFHGFVGDERYKYLLQRALTLYFPSRYEGFGIPVIEAMSLGTPVIVSEKTSLPEIVGDAGLICSANDIALAVSFVSQLSKSVDFYKNWQSKGYQHCEKFTWDKVADKIIQALKGTSESC